MTLSEQHSDPVRIAEPALKPGSKTLSVIQMHSGNVLQQAGSGYRLVAGAGSLGRARIYESKYGVEPEISAWSSERASVMSIKGNGVSAHFDFYDDLLLIVPAPGRVTYGGVRCKSGNAIHTDRLFLLTGEPFTMTLDRGEVQIVAINKQAFQETCRSAGLLAVYKDVTSQERLHCATSLPPKHNRAPNLDNLLCLIRGYACAIGQADGKAVDMLGRALMRQVIAALSTLRPPRKRRGATPAGYSRDLRLDVFCSDILERLGEHLDMRALTQIAGAPEAQIRELFRTRLNCTPKQWIIKQRLIAVRHALLEAEPGENIQQLALRYNFPTGSLSGRYMREFGEHPRETLMRGRQQRHPRNGGRNGSMQLSAV